MKKILGVLILNLLMVVLVGCSKETPPGTRAIELVKKSHALQGELSVDEKIRAWLEKKKSEVRPIGWEAKNLSGQVYLISYRFEIHSFDEGSGERGYYFEVDLNTGNVRNVTKDYQKELKPLSPPYKDEKEIAENILEDLKEDK